MLETRNGEGLGGSGKGESLFYKGLQEFALFSLADGCLR